MAPKSKKKRVEDARDQQDAEEIADAAALLAEAMVSFRSPPKGDSEGNGAGSSGEVVSAKRSSDSGKPAELIGMDEDPFDDEIDDELLLTQREDEQEDCGGDAEAHRPQVLQPHGGRDGATCAILLRLVLVVGLGVVLRHLRELLEHPHYNPALL